MDKFLQSAKYNFCIVTLMKCENVGYTIPPFPLPTDMVVIHPGHTG